MSALHTLELDLAPDLRLEVMSPPAGSESNSAADVRRGDRSIAFIVFSAKAAYVDNRVRRPNGRVDVWFGSTCMEMALSDAKLVADFLGIPMPATELVS